MLYTGVGGNGILFGNGTITATEEAEIDHLRQTLNQGHYLHARRPAGHVLWQGIYRTDTEADCPELVAVLCWGGAAKRLKERDHHIGWDSVTCANRQHGKEIDRIRSLQPA